MQFLEISIKVALLLLSDVVTPSFEANMNPHDLKSREGARGVQCCCIARGAAASRQRARLRLAKLKCFDNMN